MIAVMLLAAALQSPESQPKNCVGDEATWIRMTYDQFESARDRLPRDAGCLGCQVSLIQAYRDAHRPDMKGRDSYNSLLYQGQLLAKLGRASEAIPFYSQESLLDAIQAILMTMLLAQSPSRSLTGS